MRFSTRATVGLAIVALLVAACGSAASTAQPTPMPSLSAPPTPPSPSFEVPPDPPEPTGPATTQSPLPSDDGVDLGVVDWALGVNGHARVVTNDLRVRSRPGVSTASKKLTPLLDKGVLLFVLDGPVFRSGYEWYYVLPISPIDGPELPIGWVAAAGKDGQEWARPVYPDCPAPPTDVRALARIIESDRAFTRIPCFFNELFTFPARLGTPEATCGVELPWGIDPAWLDSCRQDPGFLVPVELPWDSMVYPAFEPGLDLGFRAPPEAPPGAWPIVEVTGQFDHEAAQECRSRLNDETTDITRPNQRLVVLECRVQFVVTAIRPTG